MFCGQALSHLPHIVHFQGHCEASTSSSRPSTAMRTILRGSIASTPDIGHALAQLPQVMQAPPQEGLSNSLPDGLGSRRTSFSYDPTSRLISEAPGTYLSLRADRSIPNSPADLVEIGFADQVSLSGHAPRRQPAGRYPVANRIPVHPELIRQLADSNDYHDNSPIRSSSHWQAPGTAALTESERPCRIPSGIPSAWTASTRILTPARCRRTSSRLTEGNMCSEKSFALFAGTRPTSISNISPGRFPDSKTASTIKMASACRA